MLFMNPDLDELIWPLKEWKLRMKDNETFGYGYKIRLELCKREIGGEMFCSLQEEFVERGIDCGKRKCANYEPCNGKSGRCKNLKNGYEGVGKFFILFSNGILQEE